MTERPARIGEHLKNAALYEDDKARITGQAWKSRVLARHDGEALTLPASGSPNLKLLMIFLPLVILVLLMIFSIWGAYAPDSGDDDGAGGALRLTMQLLDIQMPSFNLWYLVILGAGISLLTFLVRGRTPNFLPLDW
ncbi:hypothetical protein H8E52_08965 [bacterium]|nr:hypothetical protein [bacterium]